jgi:hypothetical protein
MKFFSNRSLAEFNQNNLSFFHRPYNPFLLRLLMLDKSEAILYNQNNFEYLGGVMGAEVYPDG